MCQRRSYQAMWNCNIYIIGIFNLKTLVHMKITKTTISRYVKSRYKSIKFGACCLLDYDISKNNTSCFAQLSNWAFKFHIPNKFSKLGYSFWKIYHTWISIICCLYTIYSARKNLINRILQGWMGSYWRKIFSYAFDLQISSSK